MPTHREQHSGDTPARIDPYDIPEIEPTRAETVGRVAPPDGLTVPFEPVQTGPSTGPGAAEGVYPSTESAQAGFSAGGEGGLPSEPFAPANAQGNVAMSAAETVRIDSVGPASGVSAFPAASENAAGQNPASHAPVVPPGQHPGPGLETSPKKPEGKGVRRKIIIVFAIVVVLAIVAAGAYYYWFTHSLDTSLDTGSDSKVATQLVEVDESKPFYMLLLGSDVRISAEDAAKAGTWGEGQLTDVMLLTRIDATNHVVTFVSIPRDTPYELEDGTIVKINELYAHGGAAKSVQGVSEVTGANIAHYAEVHIAELEEIVDALGGVDVDVDQRLSYEDAITGEEVTLQPGEQHINGQQAQIFARVRKDYEEDQEEHRQSNVRQLMMAILDKVLDRPVLEIPGTIVELAKYVGTDMTSADLTTLAMAFQSNDGELTVYEATGPANGDIYDAADGQWLCFENPEGWKTLMERVDAGEDPSDIDYEATEIPWPPHVEEEEE